MEAGILDRYKPLVTALKEEGQRIEKVVKRGNKTIVTVSRCEQSKKPSVSTKAVRWTEKN